MKSRFLSLSLVMLALSACTGPVIMGTDAAIIYATKPAKPPAADLSLQTAQHESWCYKTMADVECYAHPQDVDPDRLMNVDPPSRYPLDRAGYEEALHPKPPATDVVESTAPTLVVVEQKQLPVVIVPPKAPKPAAHKHVVKKHAKKKPRVRAAVPNPLDSSLPEKLTP